MEDASLKKDDKSLHNHRERVLFMNNVTNDNFVFRFKA